MYLPGLIFLFTASNKGAIGKQTARWAQKITSNKFM